MDDDKGDHVDIVNHDNLVQESGYEACDCHLY